MPATQSNNSPSANFNWQVEQAHEQAKLVLATQKDFIDALERINEHWFARARSEAELATSMASKPAATRSMPDMTTIYQDQDWFGQRMQRCVDDSNHLFADVQTLIRTGTRFAQNGGSHG